MNGKIARARAHEQAARLWLAGTSFDDMGPRAASEADMWTTDAMLDAFEAGVTERLRLAAVSGDDAAECVRFLRDGADLDPSGRRERAAMVCETLWNELGQARELVREAAAQFRFYECNHRVKATAGPESASAFIDVPGTLRKAERNAEIAGRFEQWLNPDVQLEESTDAADDFVDAGLMADLWRRRKPDFDATNTGGRTRPKRWIQDQHAEEPTADPTSKLYGLALSLAQDLGALMADSHGVIGMRSARGVEPWSSLTDGGPYQEWLSSYDRLKAWLDTNPDPNMHEAEAPQPVAIKVNDPRWNKNDPVTINGYSYIPAPTTT